MSGHPSAFDPYRSPALPDTPYVPSGRTGRPGWLTALCVISIVIGILGLFNGGFGLLGALFNEALQSAVTPAPAPGATPNMQKLQTDFQNEMNAVQAKFFGALVFSALVRIVAAGLLLAGGILCLNLKEHGRRLLFVACGVALLFEIGNGVLQSFINMEVMTAFYAFMEDLVAELPQQRGGPPPDFFLNIMKFSIVTGFVIQYLIALLKAGFYIFGLVYLQRTGIKALFISSDASLPRLQ